MLKEYIQITLQEDQFSPMRYMLVKTSLIDFVHEGEEEYEGRAVLEVYRPKTEQYEVIPTLNSFQEIVDQIKEEK